MSPQRAAAGLVGVLAGLAVTVGAAATAEACDFPDGQRPPPRVEVRRGGQIVPIGRTVVFQVLVDGCGCATWGADPAGVRVEVASAPRGPWAPARVRVTGELLVWRPGRTGVRYVRVRVGGDETRFVFVVHDRRLGRTRVTIDPALWPGATAGRTHLVLTYEPAALAVDSRAWRLPTVAVRWSSRRRAVDLRLPQGAYAASAGWAELAREACWLGPRKPSFVRHHAIERIGRLAVTASRRAPVTAGR